MTVDLYFTTADGDIDLELYDDSGSLLNDSTSGSDNESLTEYITSDGSYYIRVFYWSLASPAPSGNDYDIDLVFVF